MIGLKDSRQFFNQWESKPKPITPCTRDFSRASSKLQVIARNCDWFIALPAPVVIGRSNCFGFGFSTVIWKPLYWLMEKTDAFYWLKSDRSTFQIFCSRSLHQYRINYKFNVSVRLLTIKISQWAHEDSAVIVKKIFAKEISCFPRIGNVSRTSVPWI